MVVRAGTGESEANGAGGFHRAVEDVAYIAAPS